MFSAPEPDGQQKHPDQRRAAEPFSDPPGPGSTSSILAHPPGPTRDLAGVRQSFETALLTLDRVNAEALLVGVAKEVGLIRAVDQLMVPVLDSIGAAWMDGDLSLSQVYMSGRLCEELTDDLLPTGDLERRSSLRLAIAVLEDHHRLGKRIVSALLRSAGWVFEDYDRVTPDDLVQLVLEDRINVLLISVMMLPSALKVKMVRDQLNEAGARVRLVVGGAPFRFDSTLWREVGADVMGYSASDALRIVSELDREVTCLEKA